MRHGNPKVVGIGIRSEAGQLAVTVQDDGDGAKSSSKDGISLDPNSLGPNSLGRSGIAGMRERALALKGRLDIDTVAGRGVRLCAVLPLAGEHEPA